MKHGARFVLRSTAIRDRMVAATAAIDADRPLEVLVRPYKRDRSLDQNALYWLHVTALSEWSGYTKDEMHSILKLKLLPRSELVDPWTGEVLQTEPSTAKLGVHEFSQYVDLVADLARNLGVKLPTQRQMQSAYGWPEAG